MPVFRVRFLKDVLMEAYIEVEAADEDEASEQGYEWIETHKTDSVGFSTIDTQLWVEDAEKKK